MAKITPLQNKSMCIKLPARISGKLKKIHIFNIRDVLNFCAAKCRYPSKSYILYFIRYKRKNIAIGITRPATKPMWLLSKYFFKVSICYLRMICHDVQ